MSVLSAFANFQAGRRRFDAFSIGGCASAVLRPEAFIRSSSAFFCCGVEPAILASGDGKVSLMGGAEFLWSPSTSLSGLAELRLRDWADPVPESKARGYVLSAVRPSSPSVGHPGSFSIQIGGNTSDSWLSRFRSISGGRCIGHRTARVTAPTAATNRFQALPSSQCNPGQALAAIMAMLGTLATCYLQDAVTIGPGIVRIPLSPPSGIGS